jgi:hypothetical protein
MTQTKRKERKKKESNKAQAPLKRQYYEQRMGVVACKHEHTHTHHPGKQDKTSIRKAKCANTHCYFNFTQATAHNAKAQRRNRKCWTNFLVSCEGISTMPLAGTLLAVFSSEKSS